MSETKNRILDAAEHLFADKGLGESSLRAITQAANVNLAAVNYHFGGKDGLIRAVFARRIEALNERRLLLLEHARGHGQLSLETILDAYIRPALDTSTDPNAARYIKLLGRAYTEPNDQLRAFLPQQYDAVLARFKPELHRVLPDVGKAELYWRMHFCLGALLYCMAGAEVMQLSSDCELCDPRDVEGMIGRLVRFVAAGLRAPGLPVDTVRVTVAG